MSYYSNSSMSSRTISLSEHVADDESILLSNANRLLSAVGIVSKQILSAKELARVASSMFVAVLESLFHTRIDGINRSPQKRSDYEKNAQLVINYLSDRIEMNLKHISGCAIASGDLTSISNLVHILVRIISITSQEGDCSSIETSSDFNQDLFADDAPSGDSIQSDPVYEQNSSFAPANNASLENKISALDEVLKRTNASFRYEKKMIDAKKRRDHLKYLKRMDSRAANVRHSIKSRVSMQKKWSEDRSKEKQSFLMRRSTEEHVMMRRVYEAMLKKMRGWKIEEAKEKKLAKSVANEHLQMEMAALAQLFKDRSEIIREENISLSSDSFSAYQQEMAVRNDVMRSIKHNLEIISSQQLDILRQKRSLEMLRRRESHQALLQMISAGSWENCLRQSTVPFQRQFADAKYSGFDVKPSGRTSARMKTAPRTVSRTTQQSGNSRLATRKNIRIRQ